MSSSTPVATTESMFQPAKVGRNKTTSRAFRARRLTEFSSPGT